MNHLSEWKIIYHPRSGKFVYKHKGTGVMTDSLFKLGKTLKKPFTMIAKKTGKKVAGKTGEMVAKKAGDKIGDILRKSPSEAGRRKKKNCSKSQSIKL